MGRFAFQLLLAGSMIMLSGGLGSAPSTLRAAPQSTPTPTPPIPPHICLGCVSPIPRTFPALYRPVRGRWTSTRTAFLNEPLRFVVRVQSGVAGWSRLTVHLRIRRTYIGGRGVRGLGAGWQVNEYVPALEQALGFRYASDTRGVCPFVPVVNGAEVAVPQLPTTLPTLDELIGRPDLEARAARGARGPFSRPLTAQQGRTG